MDAPIKSASDSTARQAGIYFQGPTFASESIQHRHHPYRAALRQTVMNEVERPLLVRRGGKVRWLSHPHQALAFPPLHA